MKSRKKTGIVLIAVVVVAILLALVANLLHEDALPNEKNQGRSSEKTKKIQVVSGGYHEDTYGKDETIEVAHLLENQKNPIGLDKVLKINKEERIVIYQTDGTIFSAKAADCQINKNGMISMSGKKPFEVVGIMKNPPAKSVMDVANCADEFLSQGQKVMIVYLDGFGYDTFLESKAKGLIPFLSTFHEEPANTAYPSITPVGFAAMITGQPPKINGVGDRSNHRLSCPSIFDRALKENKKNCVIEAAMQILEINSEVLYNADFNQDGNTDDEVFTCAKETLSNTGYDLTLVHFHGIDDVSHAFGPHTKEVYERVENTDKLVESLAELWNGKIIIVADHGQHTDHGSDEKGRKGTHGAFQASDLFIPFLMK